MKAIAVKSGPSGSCAQVAIPLKPEGIKTRSAEVRWRRLGADPDDFNAFTDLFARRRCPFIRQVSGDRSHLGRLVGEWPVCQAQGGPALDWPALDLSIDQHSW